jgi:hypothetical protein
MKAGMARWLVFVMGMLALAGCQHDQSVAVMINPAPRPRPFVFYDEAGDPSERTAALSEVELREIVDWVATQTRDPVWLIRVRPDMGKTRNRMVAYLVPDETTPRIRVGRAYDIPDSKEQTALRSPWKYAQVSLSGRSFGEQLVKPSVREMPFRYPEVTDPDSKKKSPMSEQDAVAILDFVRHRSGMVPLINTLLGHTIARRGPNLPVLSMCDMINGFEVTFGFVHGPLWGHGVIVRVKCTRSGYKVVDWSKWIS